MQAASAPGRVNSIFVCCHAAAADGPLVKVANALADLGRCALVFPGLWYLETALSASEVKAKILPSLEHDESVAVIDATNHEATWRNVRPEAAELIRQNWHSGAVPSFFSPRAPRPQPRGESSPG
jgi:hypothetical protein